MSEEWVWKSRVFSRNILVMMTRNSRCMGEQRGVGGVGDEIVELALEERRRQHESCSDDV